MDPANGHVKAYVGGPNYVYFQYDMAMVGRRQVGSTIKPYLYTLAMENGFSPCDQARHVEQTLIAVSYTHLIRNILRNCQRFFLLTKGHWLSF